MPEDLDYSNRDVRDRIAVVDTRVTKLEGRHEGHESICTLRYGEIAKNMSELNTKMSVEFDAQNKKVDRISLTGTILAIIIILIELGKATIPGIIDALVKVIH